jgi:hypothetical protein
VLCVSAVSIVREGRCVRAVREGVREVRCGNAFEKCVARCVSVECECAMTAIFPPQWCVVLSRPVRRYFC